MDRSPRRWWRLSPAELLAACAVFVATAGIVQPLMAQQASRMALTAAIAEAGTVRIDRSEGALGIDYAVKDGHLYSDKAPAQPVLAVAPYLAYKAVGGDSAVHLRVDDNLGLWWISIWSAALPLALLVVVMARLARPVSARWSLPAAVAFGFGTLLFPFGSVLFSHTASALLVAGAVLVWRRRPAGPRSLFAVGLLLGGALAVEYTAVAALAVVGLASVLRDRWSARWVVVGAAGPLIGLMGYHLVALGGPLEVPYRYHVQGLHNSAVAGLTLPSPGRLWTLATAPNGLFLLTPIVLVSLYGLWVIGREQDERRVDALLAVALLGAFVIIQGGAADLTGGDSLGPRYVIPGLPGLVMGLAAAWERRQTVCTVLAGFSASMMVLATYTDPLRIAGLRTWLGLLRDGDVVDTVLDPLLGRASVVVFLAAAAALVVAALRSHERELDADTTPAAG